MGPPMGAQRRKLFICSSLGHFWEVFTENVVFELGLEDKWGEHFRQRHKSALQVEETAYRPAGLGSVFLTLVFMLQF